MKFLYILFTISIISVTSIFAQTTPPPAKKAVDPDSYVKSYIGLFGGLSSPIGDFKNATYENYKSGFAKRGVTFGLDGAVYVYRNLAVGATVSFQDQGELTQGDATMLATGYTESFKSDQATTSIVGRYHSYNFLIGPQYSIPVFKDFIVDLRAFGGALTTTTTPEYTNTLVGYTPQTVIFYQRGAKGSSFSYGGSAAVRYKLGDVVSVVLKGTYIKSEGPYLNNDAYPNTSIGRYLIRQPFNVFQTTAGFNFSF